MASHFARRHSRLAPALAGGVAVLLAIGCDRPPAGSSAAEPIAAVRGTVSYRERIALPRGATVEIRLEDVSLADAPAVVVGEQSLTIEERQVPLAFEVQYPAAAIEPRRRYAVRATIRSPAGTLLFATTEFHPAFDADGEPNQAVEIVVQRAGGGAVPADAGASTGSLTAGPWRLTALALGGTTERAVGDTPAYTIDFGADGRYSGRADCNRYAGSYQRPAPERLAMSAGIATLAACAPPSIADDFVRVVARASRYRVEGDRLRLELDDGGYLVFVRETETAAAAAPLTGRTFVFDCDGGISFTTRTGPGEVAVWTPAELGGEYRVLSQAIAASGARYVEGDLEFWNKGELATFELAGQRFVDCRSNPAKVPWADAARRGVLFRAVGNEPSWYVEVLADRFAVVTELGARRLEWSHGGAVPAAARTTYRAVDSPVTVQVEQRPCHDTMSGEAFAADATVTLEDRVLNGCGRFLTPR